MSNRLTHVDIEGLIKEDRYYFDGTLTICILETHTGFKVVGHTAPIDPKNFDVETGKEYAYQNAFDQLWELEGYKRK